MALPADDPRRVEETAGQRPATRLQDRLDLVIGWLVLALAFLLPVARRGVTITASLALLLWLLGGRWRERFRVIRQSPLLLAIFAFLLVNLLSLAWTTEVSAGLSYIAKYRYLLLAVVVATTASCRKRNAVLDALLLGTAVSLVWSYGIALGLVHFGHGYPEHAAPSMNHLDYSMFLAVAALLVVTRLAHRPTSPRRVLGWAAFLLFVVVGLLVNIGRSGQLAFFAGLVVILTRYLPGPRLLRPVLAAAVGTLVLVSSYLAIPVFRARVDSAVGEIRAALVDQQYATNQGKRIAMMVVSADILVHHPLVGTGVGDVMGEVRRLLDTRYPYLKEAIGSYRHLHNQFLQVATGLGMVGLVSLLAIFLQLLRTRTGDRQLSDLALVTASVFLVGCVGDPFLHKQLPLALFSMLTGLVAAGAEVGSPPGREPGAAGASGSETGGE